MLNAINLPIASNNQYVQLSTDQQRSDRTLTSVLSYINSIHPEVKGFIVRSVNKASLTNLTT
jgi:hypothetical protein